MMLRGSRTLTIVLFAASCIVPAACSQGTSQAGGVPLRLAMVTDVGGLGDRSFNDSANAGLNAARKRLGAEIEVLESKSAADFEPNLTLLADENYDEIFAIGYLMSKDVAAVAADNPQRRFAIVDAVVEAPNVVSITFREQEGAFLAGALAAMVSRSKRIAFLGGVDSPLLRKFEAGYIAGARQADPAVEVLVKYVGSFEDVASGKELAGVLYGDGADIIFVAAGKSGLGAIDEARSRSGVYVIGVDSNQDALAPGKVLTSMVKRVDVAVFDVSRDAAAKKRPAGVLQFGLADEGVGLTDFRYTRAAIGEKRLARLARIRAAIVAGTIVPPTTREGLAGYHPVPGY